MISENIFDYDIQDILKISLFTDAKDDDYGGWWGDSIDNYSYGSKLWKTYRGKTDQKNLNEIKQYAEECLQYLIDDNIFKDIEIIVEKDKDHILLNIKITCNDQQIEKFQFRI